MVAKMRYYKSKVASWEFYNCRSPKYKYKSKNNYIIVFRFTHFIFFNAY